MKESIHGAMHREETIVATDLCALTGNLGKYVKCHLYPRAFYPKTEQDAPLMAYSGKGDVRFPRIPIGYYDENLVVAETETFFAELDDYAFRTLKPFESVTDFIVRADRVDASERNLENALCYFESFDSVRLKMFSLSVLWRFAATTLPMGDGVTIEPHMETLRAVWANRDLDLGPQFSVQIVKLSDGQVMPVMTQVERRAGGLRIFQMVFGGFNIIIKADKRPFPKKLRASELRSDQPVAILITKFQNSQLYKGAVQAAFQTVRRFGKDPWNGKFGR